jgi:RHS repeat-associated protein
VFFAGRRIAQRTSSGTVYFYYADTLGTIHTITNGTGTACYDATFTPYGQEMLNPNISQTCSSNYKFTGYEYDSETGLYYAKARYYNPRLGRFMSTDPLAGSTSYPQSQNRYAYVTNVPSCFTDPNGLGCPLVIAGTDDNPQNSQSLENFAQSIGAVLVFPLPNAASGFFNDAIANYTSQGVSAVQQGIAAASGTDGSGPSSVITFSAGAGYYNAATVQTPTTTANIAYVMPYYPEDNGGARDMGTQSTTVFTGTGFSNDVLQSVAPTLQGANYVNTGQTHSQNVFNNLQLPFNPGPHCQFKTIVAGASGGGGGGGANNSGRGDGGGTVWCWWLDLGNGNLIFVGGCALRL